MEALEKRIENILIPHNTQNTHQTIDIYKKETTALYTPPLKIYDFPATGTQLHIHGSNDGNTLYGGGFKKYGEDKIFQKLNGYELSIADNNLQNAGIQPIKINKKW